MAELSKQHVNIVQEVEDPGVEAAFINRKNWINMVWQEQQSNKIHFLTVSVLQAWEKGTGMSSQLGIIQLIGFWMAQVIDQLINWSVNNLATKEIFLADCFISRP